MKSVSVALWPATAVLLLAAGPGFGQVNADGMGKVLPVELYTCKYKEGQTKANLMSVIDGWNRFQDAQKTDSYAAWLLTPYFYGTEQDFDVIWLGAYKDGNAMGKGLQNWLTKGGEQQAAFAKVIDCDAHSAYASAMYKAPAAGSTPASGFITIMDCKLNEEHKYPDIKAAELKWAEHLRKSGSKAGYYHWMPYFGGGDADFDYKVAFAYSSFEEIGADFEGFANGGGRELSMEIFGDIDECDDARVYISTSVREAKIRD
jgi:hypothetical protein